MPKKSPLVSLFIPTYGRAAFIGQTLESALTQTVNDLEIVVVDDHSPDNTTEVVRSFSDQRIKFTRNNMNLGVPQNLNYAMSLAKGEYLVLLEDHDLLEPDYLEETIALMTRYPSVSFVATGIVTIDEKGILQERYVETLPEFIRGRKLLQRLLTRTDCPFSVTVLIRRSAIQGLEPLFASKYWWYADQYLWLRLAAKSDFGYVQQALLRFRMRESDHFLTSRFWETYKCLDQIHRDTWKLLHPKPSLASKKDWFLYELRKLQIVAGLRAGRILRRELWTEDDDACARGYLSLLGYSVLNTMKVFPRFAIAQVRAIYTARHRRYRQLGIRDIQPLSRRVLS
jgi:glycosyltransferase involved in cell wall biosynthesis